MKYTLFPKFRNLNPRFNSLVIYRRKDTGELGYMFPYVEADWDFSNYEAQIIYDAKLGTRLIYNDNWGEDPAERDFELQVLSKLSQNHLLTWKRVYDALRRYYKVDEGGDQK